MRSYSFYYWQSQACVATDSIRGRGQVCHLLKLGLGLELELGARLGVYNNRFDRSARLLLFEVIQWLFDGSLTVL